MLKPQVFADQDCRGMEYFRVRLDMEGQPLGKAGILGTSLLLSCFCQDGERRTDPALLDEHVGQLRPQPFRHAQGFGGLRNVLAACQRCQQC